MTTLTARFIMAFSPSHGHDVTHVNKLRHLRCSSKKMRATNASIMFRNVTPHRLFSTQVHELRAALPGVLDGNERSIHDARIGTRRIREILPLLEASKRRKPLEDLQERFKRLGRWLGRVRDADVTVALLSSLETRVPHAAPSLVVVRQQRERERLELVRKLIKRLERLDAVRLVETLDDRPALPALLIWGWRSKHSWQRDSRHTVGDRARDAAEAIDFATGVYFPNRVHAARIAIKKLRYAMEVANETALSELTGAIKELKKAQDLLGDLHDRQALLDALSEGAKSDDPQLAEHMGLVTQVLEAECRELHGEYLLRRKELKVVCRRGIGLQGHRPRTSLITAAAVAASSTLYAAALRTKPSPSIPMFRRSAGGR
jgi:CHAD domain-containing protein